ncbi:EAL domain-containing protein [Nitrogeniibacter mangrovi]|uniref:EAL domain-containing protein n=1 Tax=Nitrogeniibacter mangrovi TaxID=2016596 RepID=A0A6C1B9Q4_9RHOO|nr:EAL domain-containing protein [Nitrogeniibacter mangrovi]QID19585.1 EAL domain-containing protein [Nitrogeniibacter mangrovi]
MFAAPARRPTVPSTMTLPPDPSGHHPAPEPAGSPDAPALWVVDLATLRFIDVDTAAVARFGYRRDDFLATTLEALTARADIPLLQAHLAQLADTGEACGRWRVRTHGGTELEVECRAHVTQLGDGAVAISTVWNRTAPPQGSLGGDPQRQLDERLEKTAASVPGLICSFRLHPDGHASMPLASAAIEDLYGLRAEEVAEDAAPLFALIHPDDLPQVNASVAESARTMQPWHDCFRLRHPRKGERWFEGHSLPVHEPDGGILWHGYIQDITERRRVETALRESEAYCRLLLTHAPDGIFIVDADGRHVVDANTAACRMLGLSRAALLTRTTADLVVADDIPRIGAEVERIKGGGVSTSLWHLRRADGSVFEGEATCTMLPDGRLHAVLRDISERRQVEAALRESESRLGQAQSIAHLGDWHLDLARDVLTWSDEAYRIFGIAPGTPLTLAAFIDRVHPDDRARLLAAWDNAVTHGTAYDLAHRIVVDGRIKWVRERAEVRLDADGRAEVGFGIVQDITEMKQAEEQLRIAAVAFEARDGMMVTDARGVILRVNLAFTEITGYHADEAIGQTPAILHSGRHGADFYRTLWEAIRHEGHWQGEIWNRRKDGSVYPEWLAISAIRDDAGTVTHYLGMFSDISDPRETQRKLVELAYYDALTGLPNRRLLTDRLERVVAGARPDGQFSAVLLADLDQFKTLNDTRGHDLGDQLLVEVAQRLRRALRKTDTAARFSGDEFVILLQELGSDEFVAASRAEAMAAQIHAAIAEPLALNGIACHTTLSVGITLFRDQDNAVETLLRQADLALNQAKDAGRDTHRFYNPAMQAAMEQRAALEDGLRRALAQDELRVHYQPQVDEHGVLMGAEALLRWQPPDRPMVSPGAFIPVAEATGLIVPIGHWVLDTVCARLSEWARHPTLGRLQVAVNISARQFRQPDFVDQVRETIGRHGIDATRLKFELTESVVLDDVDQVIHTMGALKALGLAFSIDDFGTGYSSLAYLKRLPLDQLKIDQGFVFGIPDDADDCAIARAVIALGHSLRLQVIAEGVETPAQRAFLARHGCLAYQGYLFGAPGPAEALEALAYAG